jgi:hypothetical protein
MRKLFLLLFLTLFLISGCTKEEVKPEFSSTPKIAFLAMSPGSVTAWKDSVIFTISYEDGDGDLGQNTAGYENLFLKDSRTGGSYTYRIRELVPDNAEVPVKGTLKFVLPFTFLSSESVNSEQVVFEIKIKDRSGKESNAVSSPGLQVNR